MPRNASKPRDVEQATLIRATAWLVGIIVLITCVIPLCGGGLFLRLLGPNLSDAKETAAQYLRLIESGDDAGAYRKLCSGVRDVTTPAAFTVLITAGRRPASHLITGAAEDAEPFYATVDVRLTAGDGTTREITLRLAALDSNPWEVCGPTLV